MGGVIRCRVSKPGQRSAWSPLLQPVAEGKHGSHHLHLEVSFLVGQQRIRTCAFSECKKPCLKFFGRNEMCR